MKIILSMKKLIFLLVFMSFCIISKAQFHVSGSVVNDNNKPIEGVYIVAYNVKTGISLKSCVSDRSGKYVIDLDKTKGVEIAFNLPGFKTIIMDKLLQTDLFNRVVMHDLSFVTDEVVISAEKYVMKPIEGGFNYKIIDKFIRKNNTSLDMLNYTPMVHISNSESINMIGKKNVVVFINGSKTNMNYTALISYLKNVPATQIKGIKVILNPTARYGVDMNTGVIDLKIKNPNTDGFRAIINGSCMQTQYNKQTLGGTFIFGKDKLSIKSNIVFKNLRDYEKSESVYYYKLTNNSNSSNSKNTGKRSYYDIFLSLKYEFTKNHKLEMSANFYNYLSKPKYNSLMKYYKSNLNKIDSTYHININSDLNTKFLSSNIRYTGIFSNGSRLYTDLYYITNNIDNQIDNEFKDVSPGVNTMRYDYENDSPQYSDVITNKLTYDYPFGEKALLSFGINSNYAKTSFESIYSIKIAPKDLPLIDHKFKFTELGVSPYVGFKYRLSSKLLLGADLGFEYKSLESKLNGKQFNSKNISKRLKPSAFFAWNNSSVQISYNLSSNTDFADFRSYSPFKRYFSPTSYSQGNPDLKPIYYLDQNLMFKRKKWSLLFRYVHINDMTYDIHKVIDKNKMITRTINYDKQTRFGTTLSYSGSIAKWWYINASSCLNYTTFIDKSEEVNLNKNGWSAEYSLNNFLTISKEKRFTSSITGNYFTNSINEYGKSYGFMQLNLSLKKNFDNFSLSLYAYRAWACRDGDFSTDRYSSIDDKYRKGYSYSIGEYQGFRISFIWNLGNTKLNKNIRKGNNEYLRRV